MDYKEFLRKKELRTIQSGFKVDKSKLNPMTFDFQRDVIAWALEKGKAAILTGCGTGKTFMQCEWARNVCEHTNGNVLIIAPLSVVDQTKREAHKFGIGDITICRTAEDVKEGINITNYEMIEHFDPYAFQGVVLDESSILKSFTGKTQETMTRMFARTPYKLLCTATIAPNDYTEIGTSCEFLGIMSRTEMLATYFTHDGKDTSKWRLKRAGERKFWEWFATWAIYFDSPAELGYEAEGYELPPLNIQTVITKSETHELELIPTVAETLQERREARRESLADRVCWVKAHCEGSDDQWLIWCDFNYEADELRRSIEGSVEVRGSDTAEVKAKASLDFSDRKIKTLISKPTIFGFGSNFQSCHNMVFCGLSDSYEQFYQAVRRCWRFGQTKPVNVYVIISERETNVLENIKRKQANMDNMQKKMTGLMKEVTLSEIKHTTRITETYLPTESMRLPSFV